MTIGSQHTVEETEALMKASQFRIDQYAAKLDEIHKLRQLPPTVANITIDKDFKEFVDNWNSVVSSVKLRLALAKTNPLPNSALASEGEFKMINGAFVEREPHFSDIHQRIDAEASHLGLAPVDLSNIPSQMNTTDVDFDAFKTVDKTIRTAEENVKQGAKDNAGLIIGVTVVGLFGLYVLGKIYLPSSAK